MDTDVSYSAKTVIRMAGRRPLAPGLSHEDKMRRGADDDISL